MSVTSQTPFNSFAAAPGAVLFSAEFRVILAADLVVRVNGATVTSGFTVAGLGEAGGVDVTFTIPMTGGEKVELLRDVPLIRATDYQKLGDFLSPVVNQDFDRLWMSQQDQEFMIGGALRFPFPEQVDDLPAAAGRMRRLFYFDETGAPVMFSGTPGTVLGFNSSGDPVAVVPADGSAGSLALDLASTASGKGAAMVLLEDGRDLQSFSDETFSVTRFGSVGDGSADDTPAFDAAVAAIKAVSLPGGSTPPALIVPAGIYNIDRILIGHSNFKMVCEPGAMFKWRGGASSIYPYFIYPDNLASSDFADFYKNIEIDGLRIDPATIATGKSVIRIGNMYAGVIKNCHIEDDGFGADTTKLALDIGNGSYKWSVENCTLPRMRCEASSAWNVTTIAFRSVGGRRLQLKNALGITANGLILEGNEVDKISLEEVNGFTNIGGDFEGSGTAYAFVGAGNTNIHSLGNDVTALTGGYTSGTYPQRSSFNDRGFPGFGFPNLNGDAAHMVVRRISDGRVLRVDSDTYGNLCVDLLTNGYVLIGPADDRISRLVSGPAGAPSLSWQADKLGFFSASPIAKPTGVAVTASGIHAALVALGLISP